ncbi:MAG TPA: 23S rRNA (pseudouridine(1915)-N(3))-methyltransferase RlmH [Stellaceae bacterium]|nr:23S rRNA (pseudouridine(1915)-N(3))-methyltransferase RlmH [Stellaceae bacterium]
MRLHVVAVGRLKTGPHADLARHYAERLKWPLSIREVEERRKLSPAELTEREAALLISAVPPGALVVALDEQGTPLTSDGFAQRLQRWRSEGVGDVAFLIGGADGLSVAVREKAALRLSLGAMTWPHLLVRGMLLEQLYRAQQILAGHPYHRS